MIEQIHVPINMSPCIEYAFAAFLWTFVVVVILGAVAFARALWKGDL